MATQSHTTIRDAPSGADVFDPYDAMILEYIEERHIVAYSLLSHHHTTAIQPYRDDSAGEVPSENSLSTNPSKTESSNDLPVLLPDHLAWAEDLQAVVASRYPNTPEDKDDDFDWSVALGAYDYLNIEEAKHVTACARVPWKEVDHLAEWREETEAFATWWDLLREMEPAFEPATVGITLWEPSCVEGTSSLLDIEAGHINLNVPSAEEALDELLPELRGLNVEL
ncbi:hypothetical protein DAEQUDRAFT_763537 [Daedalea quercina L-15889]|uniref:Uncharacterized protein n=1 Tax=Daedalea quercina L-15889 TaxID=1314783 RepID=A0A165S911_9APHY|nr:hypothetical protein DAEQUDRAFT_763537 [Daedalea quercina L-15889]